ncbi:hypothetical protein ACHAXN_007659 [Cyclotella atomus]
MKYIIGLYFLLLGTNAIRDNDDEAFRILRGQGMMGGGSGGQGMGKGMMGGGVGQGMGQVGGQMMGGEGQGMMGGGRNHTDEDKAQMCAENGIICAEVDQYFLANNCTRPERPNSNNRDLLMIVEEVHDEFFDGDRSLRGPGGRGGQGGGRGGGGRFGNMMEAEREEMKLKRLTCKCCKDHDDDGNGEETKILGILMSCLVVRSLAG